MSRKIAVVALLILIPLRALWAEEGPEETPAARFDRVAAGFPAPSAAAGFTFEGRILAGGVPLGKCVMSAEAARIGGRPVWKTAEKVSMRLGPDSMSIDSFVHLAPDFMLIDGTETEVEKGVETTRSWERTEEGCLLRIHERAQVRDVRIAVEGRALSGLASTILFCRLAREMGGVFEIRVLDPNPGEDREYVSAGRLTFGGTIDWHGTEADLVTGVLTDRTAEFAFHPESHECLGFRMKMEEGGEIEILAASIPSETSGDAAFTPPAKTPEDAALIAALAFGSGDGALLCEIVHWPSLLEAVQAEKPDPSLTVEVLKQKLVAGVNGSASKRPRDLVVRALAMIRSQLEVERISVDRATVRFPATFRSMKMTLEKFGAYWFLVELPVT